MEWNCFYIGYHEKLNWDEFYQFVCENKPEKSLSFVYKGVLYNIRPVDKHDVGKKRKINVAKLGYYDFYRFTVLTIKKTEISEIECYASFKEAIDNAKMEDGKTFKEIFDGPNIKYVFPTLKKLS